MQIYLVVDRPTHPHRDRKLLKMLKLSLLQLNLFPREKKPKNAWEATIFLEVMMPKRSGCMYIIYLHER